MAIKISALHTWFGRKSTASTLRVPIFGLYTAILCVLLSITILRIEQIVNTILQETINENRLSIPRHNEPNSNFEYARHQRLDVDIIIDTRTTDFIVGTCFVSCFLSSLAAFAFFKLREDKDVSGAGDKSQGRWALFNLFPTLLNAFAVLVCAISASVKERSETYLTIVRRASSEPKIDFWNPDEGDLVMGTRENCLCNTMQWRSRTRLGCVLAMVGRHLVTGLAVISMVTAILAVLVWWREKSRRRSAAGIAKDSQSDKTRVC